MVKAMTTYLDDLVAGARRRVDAAVARESLQDLRIRADKRALPPSFRSALEEPGVAVIAEIKRASPSRGPLALDIVAAELAAVYRDAGAAAISVLTEPDGFKGSLDDLVDVASVGVAALRKDFIVDAYQVWEARDAGAAAVLLIVAALDEQMLVALLAEAKAAGLDVLVEAHDEREVDAAVAAGADIIGINARDLRTFDIDRTAFARLRQRVPKGVVTVAESGVRDAADVVRHGREGADAVLIGETLVSSDDPGAALAQLVAAGRKDAAVQG
jgi:indole-3-glycerol phosphate synthase